MTVSRRCLFMIGSSYSLCHPRGEILFSQVRYPTFVLKVDTRVVDIRLDSSLAIPLPSRIPLPICPASCPSYQICSLAHQAAYTLSQDIKAANPSMFPSSSLPHSRRKHGLPTCYLLSEQALTAHMPKVLLVVTWRISKTTMSTAFIRFI